jgi:cell division topological specificity factor
MLNELLERLFRRSKDPDSRAEVKQRLKLLIAHDRADLSPALVESMQREILEVVSRYVEIDKSALSFSLESDRNSTALLANLPILRVKEKEDDEETGTLMKSSEDDREEDSLDNLKFDDESDANESDAHELESSQSESSQLESSQLESSEVKSSESGSDESPSGEVESGTSESNTIPSGETTPEASSSGESSYSDEVLSALDRED